MPGVPYRLKLWIDDEGVRLKADGADAVFVRAAVVDVRGVVVPSATGRVHFSVSGAGSLAGEADVPLEMGIASDLVRSQTQPGLIKVAASLPGVREGSVAISRGVGR